MKTASALSFMCALVGATLLSSRADDNGTPPPTASGPSTASAPMPKSTSPTGPWMMWTPSHTDVGEAPAWTGSTVDTTSGNGGDAAPAESDAGDAEHVAEETYAMNEAKKNQAPPESLEQTAKQQAYASDWLLRDYNTQLKKRGLEKADYSNPYLVPAPNDPTHPQESDDPLLDQPQSKKVGKSDKPSSFDDASTLTPKKSLVPLSFQPLLAPILAPTDPVHPAANLGLSDIGANDSGASMLPVPNIRPQDDLGTSSDNSVDSLLGVPGLTAASQSGIAPNNAMDFEDSSADNNRPRPPNNNFMVPTTSGSDVTEFFKKQAEGLAPPSATGGLPVVMLPSKPRLQINSEPMAKPAISGLRSHVNDPFDILQR